MPNTPEYYKTYYTIQELILKIADKYYTPNSTSDHSPLNDLAREIADKIDTYYEKS